MQNKEVPTCYINTHSKVGIWFDYKTSQPKEDGEYRVAVKSPLSYHPDNTEQCFLTFKNGVFIHPSIHDADARVLHWFGKVAVLKK